MTTTTAAIDLMKSIYSQSHFSAAGMETIDVRQEMKACIEALAEFLQSDIDTTGITDIESKHELAALSAVYDTTDTPIKII